MDQDEQIKILTDQLSTLKIEVAVLKRESYQLNSVYSKLEETLNSVNSMSSSINQMIAIQDIRLKAEEEKSSILFNAVKEHEAEDEKIHEKMEQKLDAVLETLTNKMDSIKKMIYIIIGGSIVIGFLFGRIDFIKFFATAPTVG